MHACDKIPRAGRAHACKFLQELIPKCYTVTSSYLGPTQVVVVLTESRGKKEIGQNKDSF